MYTASFFIQLGSNNVAFHFWRILFSVIQRDRATRFPIWGDKLVLKLSANQFQDY
jgi:hypothetical protein